MRIRSLLLLTALLVPALPAAAQDSGDKSGYKVDFTIRDGSDAAAKTGRRYSLLIDDNSKGNYRVGNKIPYMTGPSQFNYADVGVNIDARVHGQNAKVSLSADIDVSTVMPLEKNPPSQPTIGSVHISVNTFVTPGKPVVIASFDDPVTNRKFDIEATITKVN